MTDSILSCGGRLRMWAGLMAVLPTTTSLDTNPLDTLFLRAALITGFSVDDVISCCLMAGELVPLLLPEEIQNESPVYKDIHDLRCPTED